jgi:hypothetical protein
MFDKDDQSEQTVSSEMFKDQLEQIKNEQGEPKYKDLATALDGLKHSQEFISTLKQEKSDTEKELERLRLELEKRSSVEDVVSKLMSKPEQQVQTQEQTQEETPSSSGLSEDTVAELVAKVLQQEKQKDNTSANKKKVSDAFQEKFGDNAFAKFQELAAESNMTVAELEQLSANNPALVLKLMPDTKKEPTVTQSSVSSASFLSKPVQEESGILKASDKSILAGASSNDLKAEMRRHKEAIYRKHGITG